MSKPLLKHTKNGLYCEPGEFYIDPHRSVERAVITHAHSDHARSGHKYYLASAESKNLLKLRLGNSINLQTSEYGEKNNLNGVSVSFHPAGHILGSSQIRLEYKGEVWVVSGDYKLEHDKTCQEFELVKCHTFITECTFGLPIYRWQKQEDIFNEINSWWLSNKISGRTSIIYGYSLGKAQRILSGLDPSIGPITVVDSIMEMSNTYCFSGIHFPPYINVKNLQEDKSGDAIIIAPPNLIGSYFLKKFHNASSAFASGWMQIRKARKSSGFDRGFVLSDHVDWNGINKTIDETGAENIWVMHGYTFVLAQWLKEKGKNVILQRQSSSLKFEVDESTGNESEIIPEQNL